MRRRRYEGTEMYALIEISNQMLEVGCVPIPSIERKSNSWLRQPLASAHVQR